MNDIALAKFKSNREREHDIESQRDWQAPLKRRLDKDGNVVEITIRVKLYVGDSEYDFKAKFPGEKHNVKLIVDAIAAKEQLDANEAKMFSLWVIGKDLGSSSLMKRIAIKTKCRYTWNCVYLARSHGSLHAHSYCIGP